MLLWVRNRFGVVSVLVNGGLLVLVVGYGSVKLQTIAAYALSWFLLLAGVRMVLGAAADRPMQAPCAGSLTSHESCGPRFGW
jgi:Peptidase M50B-like